MAISKENLTTKMQIRSSYGVVDGKEVIRSRTYSNVKEDALDEGVYAVAEAIAGLQEAVMEEVILVEASLLVSL